MARPQLEAWRTTRDPMDDFERRDMTFGGVGRLVLISGEGPAVIVMTELPGISPEVARFARRVRDLGLSVYLPNLFGDPGRPATAGYNVARAARACVAREFEAFRGGRTAKVTDWLRALAAAAHRERGGPGVGAIGMCFTGNFALSMMLEPSVLAPVLCQPSLPLVGRGKIATAPEDLQAIRARMEREDLVGLGYRFSGDLLCRKERFDAYERALGDRIRLTTLPDSAANPASPMSNPHSVVTQHLIDEEGQPTRRALDEILALFRERLLPASSD